MKKTLVILVCLGFMMFGLPRQSLTFQPQTFGDGKEITVWGFLRNNTGMFLEDQPWYVKNGNQLATERTWFRTYVDLKMSDQFKLYGAMQFVYEPRYPIERGSPNSDKDGFETYSEYKKLSDVLREAYVEWVSLSKKNSIRLGRQIAIWGESLTTRVGDVIHPDDMRFTFAFANLEDTRIPQYMIRGIHDIDSLSSSFEWIASFPVVGKEYLVTRLPNQPASASGDPGQRFAAYPESRFMPPDAVGNPGLGGAFTDPRVVVGPPMSRDWSYRNLPPIPGNKWIPAFTPYVDEDYPTEFDKTRFGFRTGTMTGGAQFGVLYFHTQEYNSVMKMGSILVPSPAAGRPGIRNYTLTHPDIDIIGVYANKQLPWPGIIRGEAIYVPNKPFGSLDPGVSSGVTRKEYYKYMIAYDLNGFLYFDWHKTAAFDVTLEHVGEYIPQNTDLMYLPGHAATLKQWNPSFTVRISTNWLYNVIATDLVAGYIGFGNSGLIIPTVKWMPKWWNSKFSAELKYINIFGDNDYEGLGIFRQKDMVVLTTQFTF
jgi:hypothetical protein